MSYRLINLFLWPFCASFRFRGAKINTALTLLTIGLIYAITATHAVADDQTTMRSWTEAATNRTIQARLLRVEGANVVLQRADGPVFEIPLARLTSDDRDYATQIMRQPAVKQGVAPPGVPVESDSRTRTVVAEGVGMTSEDALKDAFRAAVRQVVGEVVDAETLVKNDQIVKDQILTYSDGFIPSHTKLAEQSEGGLFRVTIRAVVERGKLQVRLRAVNVSLRPIDGQSLFGSITTQLEKEKDAAALLAAAFDGFPQNCVSARIADEPKIVKKDEATATLRFEVQVIPNIKAYKSFADRLRKTLDAIAKERGQFLAAFKRTTVPDLPNSEHFQLDLRSRGVQGFFSSAIPQMFVFPERLGRGEYFREDVVTIALATHSAKSGEQINFTYFLLDRALRSAVDGALHKKGHTTIKLVGSSDEILFIDQFPLCDSQNARVPYDGSLISAVGSTAGAEVFDRRKSYLEWQIPKLYVFLIAPVFLGAEKGGIPSHKPLLRLHRDITLPLEDIKAIATAKCEVEFKP